jgi:hypothetical protein
MVAARFGLSTAKAAQFNSVERRVVISNFA